METSRSDFKERMAKMQDDLDILREVGSIAAAHGSIALSEILGKRINLLMPSVDIISSSGIPGKMNVENVGMAVISRMVTGLTGQAVFMMDERNAYKLIELSNNIRKEDKQSYVITEVGISSIKEIGNIVTSAYLNALSIMFKRAILALPPVLISGTIDEILNIIISSSGADECALLIEAAFEEPQEKIKGGFYLVLIQEAVVAIQEACKQMLFELETK